MRASGFSLPINTALPAKTRLRDGTALVESIYRLEGKVETSAEVLAVFKTTREAWPRFEQRLKELHPYEVPEIVALRPEEVSAAYARWVGESVG